MAVVFDKNYLDTDKLSTGNNWIIKYHTDTAGTVNYSRVSFLGESFNVDPDPNGNFSFNFKSCIGDKINSNNFNDNNNVVDVNDSAVFNDGSTYQKVSVTIAIFIEGAQTNVYTQDYRFVTSVYDEEVYELGIKNITPEVEILLPVVDGEQHIQGTDSQPLDFSIYSKVDRGVQLFNLTNNTFTTISLLEGVNRVFLQGNFGNTIGSTFALEEGVNKIQLDMEFLTDPIYLYVTIKGSGCCSVLKWLNLEGGFGYHVFQHKVEDYSSKTKGFLENDYGTFDDYEPNAVSTGVDMIRLLGFTSIRVSEIELASLEGLISSPKVYQMLTNVDGDKVWKERVFKQGEMRIKQTGKKVFDFEIDLIKSKKGYRL